MRLPSLTSLQMLEAAARLSSFTRAAAELNVTESAISRQIQALEVRYGVRFFDRVNKRVVLTSEGDRFVREIRAQIKGIERATQDLASRAGGMEVIELAVVPTFATQWLIPRLGRFRDAHPRIIVNLHARPDPFHFPESPFDAAIYFGALPWEGYPHEVLMDEGPAMPVCSPALLRGHPIERREDILRLPLLHLASRPDAWPDWVSTDDDELRRRARLGSRYDLFSMMICAAVSGLGVALLPAMMVQAEVADGRLTALPASLAPPDRRDGAYFMTYRHTKPGANKLDDFLDWLRAECGAGDRKAEAA
ncbi:DNA-binding transcriptional LysR family regulator [Cupriavidus gilardii J11]|uniref:DNA-binding transcriptional LysR family regulator n=1 Tax=Cupriavidus gilardii J11 TaxID=936133 RepID=A0A562BTS7_9BURK|nr:LysR substrate-binding domain-containing protein [Cupriavidus gilardii]TWG88677.1 DNA-binding transcriptional LysR family regulator [Cupriavidus gilardii J11]